MAARLEHEAGADPVILGHEMLALLAHRVAVQGRAAAGDDADRIARRVGIDAEEGLAIHDKRSEAGPRSRSRPMPLTRKF